MKIFAYITKGDKISKRLIGELNLDKDEELFDFYMEGEDVPSITPADIEMRKLERK